MRLRTTAAALSAVLAVTLAGPASAGPGEPAGPDLPPQASATAHERAGAALERAQALFAARGPRSAGRRAAARPDATMALNALIRVRDDLSPAQQREADRLLARPTSEGGDRIQGHTVAYENGEATPVCGPVICVHYANGPDPDAPPATDTSPANGIPDAVDRTLATTEAVHAQFVDAGYRRPDPDGALGGGADQVDIYLADLGSLGGLYGYCTSDQPGPTYNRWAYCVVDDDYSSFQFPDGTPLTNLQVTMAHEYFHAVQYAYDAFEDPWVMEATATWAEEQVFDDVDDNRQFIPQGQVGQPSVPLDQGGSNAYGNWIFLQYLTERWPGTTGSMPTLVLELWQRMSGRTGDPDAHSTLALKQALKARGAGFTTVYGQFADGMRRPSQVLEEGGAAEYAPAAPVISRRLTPSRRATPSWWTKLDHLTNRTIRVKPSAKLRQRDWRLKVRVDMPGRRTAPAARVLVHLKNGAVNSSALTFRKRGYSTKVVGFSARKVRHVEIVLANASLRSTCWQDTWYGCQGDPRDDDRRFDLDARAFRR